MRDVAQEIHAPGIGPRVKRQCLEWNGDFRGPTVRTDGTCGLPDSIPVIQEISVVLQQGVAALTIGIDLKEITVLPVIKRIQYDYQAIVGTEIVLLQ